MATTKSIMTIFSSAVSARVVTERQSLYSTHAHYPTGDNG